ncbi:unnamed protein product [Hydatigera taeniaeformis]|uniref:Protein TESPA1 n=1 Tax=Hydatigena taeniaeformis TaxID=6205 RepID=A0A0R3WJD2_HYDTA|nr:unnamed protein product [Hydatigera taeniaeformis]
MDTQDDSTHSMEEPHSKELAAIDIPQVSMLNRPPLPPSLQKTNITKSFLGELEAETLSKESLENSSDSSVLDPDDNLLEALADNETLTAVLTSFFANISETKGKMKEEFVLKNCIDEETIRCGDAHQGNGLVPGHKTLTSPFTESTEELRKAALHGDILAQWRLSQRVENTASLGARRQDIENSLTSMATNEPPENHLFTNLNHSARPLQSWGSAYLPSRKRGSSIRCQQSSSSAYRGFVPTYPSQQMLRSKQKLKSLCSQFDLTSRPYDPWISSEVDCLPISESHGSAATERWERSLMTLPMPTSTPHSSFTLVSSLPPSPEYSISNTRIYKDCPIYKEHLHRDAILTDLKAARSMCARKLE